MRHPVGIIIIHGTFGSPLEFTPLVQELERTGYYTHLVTLPGHDRASGTSLKDITAQRLIEHCKDTFQEVSQYCDKVILMGHSLGGALALLTAASYPTEHHAVIALSTPYEHAFFVNYTHGFLRVPLAHLLPGLFYAPNGFTGIEGPTFRPWWFPQLYQEAHVLLKELQQSLPKIVTPVMLAHSPYDLIVPYQEMQKMTQALPSPSQVATVTLRSCGHQIFPHSAASLHAVDLIQRFIQDTLSAPTLQLQDYATQRSMVN